MRNPALSLLARAGLRPTGRPERLFGGDMGDVWRIGDNVVKCHTRPPRGLYAAEARGLECLRAAGAVVPAVHWAGHAGIVMDWLGHGEEDWPALGVMVATLHQDRRAPYGSEEPVFLGRFPLPEGTGDWPHVFAELRIRPLLSAARGVLGPLANRVESWLRDVRLPEEGASLVHGDLWSGNVHFGANGPALIDPSVQRAERGLDIAMMKLFGGFPPAFWSAYEEVWAIPDEIHRALPAYRLYFLLLHVHFFGAGYLPGVQGALGELGA